MSRIVRHVAECARAAATLHVPCHHRALSAVAAAASSTPASAPPLIHRVAESVAEYPRVEVVMRSKTGSKSAQWSRMNGYIPGMIYGGPGGNAASTFTLTMSKEEDLRKEIFQRKTSFLNTMYEIEVDGKIERVVPRDVQLHPFKPKIINVNWLRYTPGRYPGTRFDLPLKAINEEKSPGMKEGGWLLELVHKVPVFVHGPTIPDYLYLDLAGKKMGEKIMASELELAPGVVIRSKQHDFAVARLLGSKRGGAGGEDGEEGAEKAAGEKKEKKEAAPAAKKE